VVDVRTQPRSVSPCPSSSLVERRHGKAKVVGSIPTSGSCGLTELGMNVRISGEAGRNGTSVPPWWCQEREGTPHSLFRGSLMAGLLTLNQDGASSTLAPGSNSGRVLERLIITEWVVGIPP
jgi:hypothetical protein